MMFVQGLPKIVNEGQAAGRTSALLESHKVAYTRFNFCVASATCMCATYCAIIRADGHPVLNFVAHLAVMKKYYSDHSIYKVPYIFLLEACHVRALFFESRRLAPYMSSWFSLSISIAATACYASVKFKANSHSLASSELNTLQSCSCVAQSFNNYIQYIYIL